MKQLSWIERDSILYGYHLVLLSLLTLQVWEQSFLLKLSYSFFLKSCDFATMMWSLSSSLVRTGLVPVADPAAKNLVNVGLPQKALQHFTEVVWFYNCYVISNYQMNWTGVSESAFCSNLATTILVDMELHLFLEVTWSYNVISTLQIAELSWRQFLIAISSCLFWYPNLVTIALTERETMWGKLKYNLGQNICRLFAF